MSGFGGAVTTQRLQDSILLVSYLDEIAVVDNHVRYRYLIYGRESYVLTFPNVKLETRVVYRLLYPGTKLMIPYAFRLWYWFQTSAFGDI